MNRPKEKLATLIRGLGDSFTVLQVANELGVSRPDASKTLARWAKQGWLTRLKQGLYTVVPIDAISSDQALEDPWSIVPELFAPCYIGGWSALEYWGLTEQIFRTICIITENTPRAKSEKIHGMQFSITQLSNERIFGTDIVWRKNRRVLVSDIHKTIIDILHRPNLGGGHQLMMESFEEYLKHDDCDLDRLVTYAEKMGNGAIFKRLGFLSEKYLGMDHSITLKCKQRITQGNSPLDNKIKQGVIISRWNLIVPNTLKGL